MKRSFINAALFAVAADAVASSGGATQTGQSAQQVGLRPEELTPDNLENVVFDGIMAFTEKMASLAKEARDGVAPAIRRGNLDQLIAVRKEINAQFDQLLSPRGVVNCGQSFMNGKTDKNQPANGINVSIRAIGKDGKEDTNFASHTVNITRGLDALTGDGENKSIRTSFKMHRKAKLKNLA
jgi:hypothetical protein